MMKRFVIALTACALPLAGCGSSSLPSLTTGSLFSSEKKTADIGPPPDDPTTRAVHVGVTVARAQKCGYFFDPQKVRSNFLATEAQRNAAPETLRKLETSFDFARNRVAQQIASNPAYCSAGRTATIKKDLNRYLAGDFTAPQRKKVAANSGGIFGNLDVEDKPDNFDPSGIYDPILGAPDKNAAPSGTY